MEKNGRTDEICILPSDENCCGITGIWLGGCCPLSVIGQSGVSYVALISQLMLVPAETCEPRDGG